MSAWTEAGRDPSGWWLRERQPSRWSGELLCAAFGLLMAVAWLSGLTR